MNWDNQLVIFMVILAAIFAFRFYFILNAKFSKTWFLWIPTH